MNVYNKTTEVIGRVADYDIISKEKRNSLVADAEQTLGDIRYGWKASIDNFCMQLETNSPHLYEFWIENWFGEKRDARSHGRIYAVLDPDFDEGRPHAYYNPQTKTAVIYNTEYYGQCKSWALGIVCDIAEDQHDIHSIHGSCVEINGQGVVLIAPTGTGKSTHSYALLKMKGARIHSDDWLYVRFIGRASAEISERKFYLRTNIVRVFPEIRPLLNRCKLENVKTLTESEIDHLRKAGINENQLRKMAIDSYIAHEYSRAMLDPRWIAGSYKFVDTTRVKKVILLERDRNNPEIARKMEVEEAVDYLEKHPKEQYLNPYLIVRTPEKIIVRNNFFRRLFQFAPPYLVNTCDPVDKVQRAIRQIVKEKE
jgi:hypothetical protein